LIGKFIVAAAVMSGFIIASTDITYASGNQCGVASWYAQHTRTASGERMNPGAMTAAHRRLPFGTVFQVTRFAALPTAGILGTEQRKQERRALRLSAPR